MNIQVVNEEVLRSNSGVRSPKVTIPLGDAQTVGVIAKNIFWISNYFDLHYCSNCERVNYLSNENISTTVSSPFIL